MPYAAPTMEPPRHDSLRPSNPASSTRLRLEGLSEAERNYALAMHLAPFGVPVFLMTGIAMLALAALVAPLVLWLIRREGSVFNDDHGREVLNFCITFVILNVVLLVTIIGVAFMPFLWIFAIVSMIRGAIASSRGEYFRYPMTFRFLP
jgi:uncharacterized protein